MKLRRALARDARVGLAATAGGFGFAGLLEWGITLWAHPGPTSLIIDLRLLCLVATLMALVWMVVGPLAAIAAAAPRAWTALLDGKPAALARPEPWPAPSRWRLVTSAHVVVGGLAVVGYAIVTTWVGHKAINSFQEPTLTALVIAVAALVIGAGAAFTTRVLAIGLGRLGARLPRGVIAALPWVGAALFVGAAVAALLVTGHFHRHLRPVWPWRKAITMVAFVVGVGLSREWSVRRPRRLVGKRRALALAAAIAVLVPATLVRIGAAPQVKFVVVSSSPSLARVIELVRTANDLDRDGFGSLLGENDCAPRNKKIHPGARDYPDNGIDENCDGRDFSMRDLAVPTGPQRPVPPAFAQPWNVLLITIDTVRYDYTSFGRDFKGPRKRDTTPRLKELAERSTDFTFAQAPSAGTMASVPAIITSKFFHSGIALDESNNKHGMPPRLKPENLTLPEIMKLGGYATGAILSHEYFNDWGMQQGVDSYDNEIGKTHDPNRVSSDRLTDRALAWIARHPTGKWFLWIHYLDPHSQYVSHPGETEGDTPEDLYEGELHFTDKHIGRLLDELIRLPGGDRTIIVLTSDHGDAFGEHGFSGHAVALYREILHVPLLVFVPNNPPRKVGGVVSNLDVVPTIAALCGIDVGSAAFEGRSLVPGIFYGETDPERVVFAETNYPVPIRAAVSATWKLVFNMKSNFYELYDLVKDPMEKVNVASSAPADLARMKQIMDAWLERVVFSRDVNMNQVALRMQKVLLPGPPSPTHATPGLSLDKGAIEVLGYDVTGAVPNGKATVAIYLHAVAKPSRGFRFGAALWAAPIAQAVDAGATTTSIYTAPMPTEQARAGARVTLDGLLPADRWHPGEYLREELTVALPPTWTSAEALVGLVVGTPDGTKPDFTGPQPANDPSCLTLGPTTVLVPPANPLISPDAGVAAPPP